MTQEIMAPNFTYTLIRRKRKSVSIKIEPEGSITVIAPKRLSHKFIKSFLLEKESWIVQKQIELSLRPRAPLCTFESGSELYYLGYKKTLVILKKKSWKFCFSEKNLVIETPNMAPPVIEKKFKVWFKEMARDIITDRVTIYESLFDRKPLSIKLNQAKTRWGSCSTAGNLNFNWNLIKAPMDVLDYVVIHELAHSYPAQSFKGILDFG